MAGKKPSEIKSELEKVLGPERVFEEEEVIRHYGPISSEAKKGDGIFLIKPRNTMEVKKCVAFALDNWMNVTPISSGPPHIRGDSAPERPGIMIDLSEMKKIIRKDRRNKVAIIEPGVTYGELISEVDPIGLRVLMPFMPRPEKSVIAGCLEREPITIPKYHWDMTDPLLCTEIVFGTGDVFRTGSAAGPGTLEQQWEKGGAQKNPMGPAQTDIVRLAQGAQGTMGIVTWASIKLEVKPAVRKFYFACDEKLEKLVEFAYALHRIKLADEVLILNGAAVAAACEENPQKIDELRKKQKPFIMIYAVAGYEYFPEERVEYQEKDIADIAQKRGILISGQIPGLNGRRAEKMLSSPCEGIYWKNRLKGACKEIFFLTTLNRAKAHQELAFRIIENHGFSRDTVGIYIQPMQHGRICHMEFDIYYDSSDEKESARIDAVYTEMSFALAEAGAFFSRPYGIWADMVYEKCPDTVDALKKMKRIFDPNGIMNGGKLCFQEV